jgi:hypothetical protein
MPAVQATVTEPDTQRPDPQAVAERALRSGPYPALDELCCDYRGGVLAVRGCLPNRTR